MLSRYNYCNEQFLNFYWFLNIISPIVSSHAKSLLSVFVVPKPSPTPRATCVKYLELSYCCSSFFNVFELLDSCDLSLSAEVEPRTYHTFHDTVCNIYNILMPIKRRNFAWVSSSLVKVTFSQ